MEELIIDDVTLDQSQARVTIRAVPDEPGIAAKVFERVASDGVFVDMIVQSHGRDGHANLSFTVPRDKLEKSVEICGELAESLDCGSVTSSPSVAKLSVSGIGLRSHTGVAIRMFRSLADAEINVEMINTSEVRVNVVVDGSKGHEALAVLQNAFADATR
jgi:aspartate kinase